MTQRMIGSLAPATGLTFALFWTMTALIAVEEVERMPDPIEVVRWVSVRQEVPPQTRPPRQIVRPKAPAPLEPVPPLTLEPSDPRHAVPGLREEPFDPGEDPTRGLGRAPSDGDAIPLLRIPPTYPERALARGIEGRVLVEFTIDASGTVRDPFVVAAEPSAIFDRAALAAVRQWRYSPRVVNGRAVERRGVRIAIPFLKDER